MRNLVVQRILIMGKKWQRFDLIVIRLIFASLPYLYGLATPLSKAEVPYVEHGPYPHLTPGTVTRKTRT